MKTHCLALLFIFIVSSCVLPEIFRSSDSMLDVANENQASRLDDFTLDVYQEHFGEGVKLFEYKVGDRFRLRKPMFLYKSVSGVVDLSSESDGDVPLISNYKLRPSSYSYGGSNSYQVIRFLPAGSEIEVVAIKFSVQATISYFVFPGDENWFRCSSFDIQRSVGPAGGQVLKVSHNDVIFEKMR